LAGGWTGDAAYSFELTAQPSELLVVDAGPVVAAVAADVRAQVPAGRVAARFHAAVVQMIVEVVRQLVVRERVAAVGLTGGVFQNVLLTEWVSQRLRDGGVHVLTHRAVPCNDGGLALGQAGLASGALAANSRPE
jgi:hydrogenase maturation protein HypF